MSQKVVCVVPTVRPESMAAFREAWRPLFEKHSVTLVTVWDGEKPRVDTWDYKTGFGSDTYDALSKPPLSAHRDLFCRFTDSCRNIGFVYAAKYLDFDVMLTLDDDCLPPLYNEAWDYHTDTDGRTSDEFMWEHGPHDPIAAHLSALSKKVPVSWMNTAHCDSEYLRGVPYSVRDEAPVMLSHGVWVGTPDFDGETQLRMEVQSSKCNKCGGSRFDMNAGPKPLCLSCGSGEYVKGSVPQSLPYYVGPIPKGVLFPLCGMSVAVKREALPYLYYAPMGPDSGVSGLHRFGDIWMGVHLKREFDRRGWAVYTGGSVVHHSRASDAAKNFDQEKLGREWNEWLSRFYTEDENLGGYGSPKFWKYLDAYAGKRERYAELVDTLLQERGRG